VAAALSASAIAFVVGGMSQTSQCTNSPLGIMVFGTSGSSTINTRLLAEAGTPLNSNAGLTLSASHEYFEGIASPFLKAGLVIFIAPGT
jgi:hypothetical protein